MTTGAPTAAEVEPLDFPALFKLIPGYDPIATAGDSWFDADRAQLACDFFPECLTHVEGALGGKPFVLEPHQQSVIGSIFGWMRRDEMGRTVRRYREVFYYLPRKNGKTPVAAGICVYVHNCDGERGAQIYSAAADTEQASILFRHSRGMIENNARLSSMSTIYGGVNQRSIVLNSDQASVYRVLSADANTKHGGNSHLVLIDELHAQKNRDLVDVLQTSMASSNRAQPLLIFITTADFKRESICNEKLDYARKVRDGIIQNPSFLPIIYECTDKEDWTSPEVWARVNPNLGVSVSLKYMQDECKRAQEVPGYTNTFKRLHLNLQTDSDVAWLDVAKWDACQTTVNTVGLEGQPCYGGLDLSTTTDITNFSLIFPPFATENEAGEPQMSKWTLLQWFFVPADNARKRELRDRVPYGQWINEGHIDATPGNVVDYDFVKAKIAELASTYTIKAIAFDRWGATQISIQLKDMGANVLEFGQGFRSMSEPAKEFEKLILSQQIVHNGNPVMRWMVSNCAIIVDPAGNIKPAKNKSTNRIDGVVGTCMAIGLAITDESAGPSFYETAGKDCL